MNSSPSKHELLQEIAPPSLVLLGEDRRFLDRVRNILSVYTTIARSHARQIRYSARHFDGSITRSKEKARK
jgi:hypothetical protein